MDANSVDYIPLPYLVATSKDAAMIGHYAGLRALAWKFDFERTETYPANQLWNFLGLSKSRFYDVINRLESLGWIKKNQPYPGSLQIWFPVLKIGQSDLSDGLSGLIESYNDSLLTTTSPINRTVRLIGQTLRDLGVQADLAGHFEKTLQPAMVLEAIEVYQWARETRLAKSPGFLVRMLQENWAKPEGYIPPGWRCPECKGRIDAHAQGCPRSLSAWADDYDCIEIESICPTCGQAGEHTPDCWRYETQTSQPV